MAKLFFFGFLLASVTYLCDTIDSCEDSDNLHCLQALEPTRPFQYQNQSDLDGPMRVDLEVNSRFRPVPCI